MIEDRISFEDAQAFEPGGEDLVAFSEGSEIVLRVASREVSLERGNAIALGNWLIAKGHTLPVKCMEPVSHQHNYSGTPHEDGTQTCTCGTVMPPPVVVYPNLSCCAPGIAHNGGAGLEPFNGECKECGYDWNPF